MNPSPAAPQRAQRLADLLCRVALGDRMAFEDLYKAGKITLEEALKNADSKNNLRLKISLDEADVGKKKDHIFLHLDHLDPAVLHERLPGISESARIFAGVDVSREPIPVIPTVHYNMGGIPTNWKGEVLTKKNGNDDFVVPGLMALGEAGCVSVHGANRLGSNSLIDLVVFGRAAALRCAEKLVPNGKQPELPADSADLSLSRLDKYRYAKGATATARLRERMQHVMQNNCAVFRTGEVLSEGKDLIAKVHGGIGDIGVSDRSLIFNTDLARLGPVFGVSPVLELLSAKDMTSMLFFSGLLGWLGSHLSVSRHLLTVEPQ